MVGVGGGGGGVEAVRVMEGGCEELYDVKNKKERRGDIEDGNLCRRLERFV